eukprot:GHVQ01031778.1.p1 GENE.GHVQ01031778.1~~GHVQ01031778.1.p1  ORF type:complete len:415 (+),score=37.46 GHVQ01031778.1:231-1475(+)
MVDKDTKTAGAIPPTKRKEQSDLKWSTLVQCLDRNSVMLIQHDCEEDGVKAWRLLKNYYSGKEKPRMRTLMSRLTQRKLEEGKENIQDYLIDLQDLSLKLAEGGEKISDQILVSICLNGLPETFIHFKTLHNYGSNEVTWATHRRDLLTYSTNFLKKPKDAVTTEVAYFSKATEKKGYPKVYASCFFCNKLGHRFKDCRARKNHTCEECGKKGHRGEHCHSKKVGTTNYSASTIFNKDSGICFMTNNEDSSKSDTFLIDSACNKHMLNSKKWFKSLDSTPYGEVTCANGSTSTVKGRGMASLIIRAANGCNTQVHLEAEYTPEHKTNLLSAGETAEKGHIVTFSEHDLSMMTASGIKINLSRTPNRLHTVPVLGPTDTYLQKAHQEMCLQASSTIMTWQRRLGHINMRAISSID